MTSYKLSAGAKNAVDTLLGLGIAAVGWVAANATSFGKYAPEASLIGLIAGYALSDALSEIEPTAAAPAPTAATVYSQASASLTAFLALPNLTSQEKLALELAQGVVQAKTPVTSS